MVTDYLDTSTSVEANNFEPQVDSHANDFHNSTNIKNYFDSNLMSERGENKSVDNNGDFGIVVSDGNEIFPGQASSVNRSNVASNSNHFNNNHHNNMVPIISVTPHSPGAKYNNILGNFTWFHL